MQSDLISVIIPVYNGGEYLKKCLDSVLNQTYRNLQIILVDDGSTDDSLAVCREYMAADERITVIHQPNSGQASARNTGLKAAAGTWIGFVDDDDVICPKMYEVLHENAVRENVLISGCATMRMVDDKPVNYFKKRASGICSAEDLILDMLYQTTEAWGAVWNKIWHVSLRDRLFFPEGFQLEDYWVSFRLYYETGRVYFDNRPLYNWYVRNTTQSHKGFAPEKLTIIEITEKIRRYFSDGNAGKAVIEGCRYFSFINYCELIRGMSECGDPDMKAKAGMMVPDAWAMFPSKFYKRRYDLIRVLKCVYQLIKVRASVI